MDRVFLYHLELHILLELWHHLVDLVSGRELTIAFITVITSLSLTKFLL